jgi:hypothetical protein
VFTRQHADQVVTTYLDEHEIATIDFESPLPRHDARHIQKLVIVRVDEHDFGWVYFYDGSAHVVTGKVSDALVGNAPLIVDKVDGKLMSPAQLIQSSTTCRNIAWATGRMPDGDGALLSGAHDIKSGALAPRIVGTAAEQMIMEVARTYLEPTREAGRDFFSRGITGPVVMLNLLRFRATADYRRHRSSRRKPHHREAAYRLYMDHTRPYWRNGWAILFFGREEGS